MADLFVKAGLVFTPQRVIGPYIVDFAFPDVRLVVECDGSYWHSLPGKPAKDRQKDGYLRRHGWRVIRLLETDIRADITIAADAGPVDVEPARYVHDYARIERRARRATAPLSRRSHVQRVESHQSP